MEYINNVRLNRKINSSNVYPLYKQQTNKERFNYSDDLVSIFKNTVELLDSKKQY